MSLTKDEEEQFRSLLAKLNPQESANILKTSPEAWKAIINSMARELKQATEIPRFEWNSNLSVFKAILKMVEAGGAVSEQDIVDQMQQKGLLTSKATVKNYGYVYPETGLFQFDGQGRVALTEMGKQIAKVFNSNSDLSALEILICRGLQQQSAGYAYLNFIAEQPGIFRADLIGKLVTRFGGQGRFYAGYYTRVFKQLKLIRRTTEGGKARYWLTIQTAWSGAAPESPEDDES